MLAYDPLDYENLAESVVRGVQLPAEESLEQVLEHLRDFPATR